MNKKQARSQATRQKVMQVANRIVQNNGVDALTIDGVAKEAGLSKGGLLYHFPNKEALIGGMVDEMIRLLEEQLEEEIAKEPDRPGRVARAYIRATTFSDPDFQASCASMLAAVNTNPQLLKRLQASYEKWQLQMEQDGISANIALLIRLAMDGLWFAQLLNLAPPNRKEQQQLVKQLFHMTKGALK